MRKVYDPDPLDRFRHRLEFSHYVQALAGIAEGTRWSVSEADVERLLRVRRNSAELYAQDNPTDEELEELYRRGGRKVQETLKELPKVKPRRNPRRNLRS